MIGVLIVDDESDIRLVIRALIETHDRGVFVKGEAGSGREALDHLEEIDPEVIVLDQRMPEMDGLATATQVLKRRPNQAIILCSAYLDESVRRQAEAAGIRICMTKSQIEDIPAALSAMGSG